MWLQMRFSNLGDKRKTEYLDNIVTDAMMQGQEMQERIIKKLTVQDSLLQKKESKK